MQSRGGSMPGSLWLQQRRRRGCSDGFSLRRGRLILCLFECSGDLHRRGDAADHMACAAVAQHKSPANPARCAQRDPSLPRSHFARSAPAVFVSVLTIPGASLDSEGLAMDDHGGGGRGGRRSAHRVASGGKRSAGAGEEERVVVDLRACAAAAGSASLLVRRDSLAGSPGPLRF